MRAAMVYRGAGPHPAHEGFAEAIGADLIGLDEWSIGHEKFQHSIPEELINGILLPDYDVYIAEGTRSLYGLVANNIIRDSILIYLVADQSIYDLLNPDHKHQSVINKLIAQHGIEIMSYIFNLYIDGVIAVSEFALDFVEEIVNDKASKIAHPYIQTDLYKRLASVTPNLKDNVAVTVGEYAPYKGQDLLVDAWPLVQKKYPTAELKLVGAGYPPEFNNISGVNVCGYVEKLESELASSSLYVQPSRADTYPVSVLEALQAGLPALVTETTGNYTEIKQIDSDLIVEPNPDKIASGIIDYFDKDIDERKRLSDSARERGSNYDAKRKKQTFENQFNELITDIE